MHSKTMRQQLAGQAAGKKKQYGRAGAQTRQQPLVAQQKGSMMSDHSFHYYSAWAWLSFLVLSCALTAACTGVREQTVSSAQLEAAQVEQIIERYEEIKGPPFDEFLETLNLRLETRLPPAKRVPLSFKLLRSEKVFAVSSPAGTVVFSSGLVMHLNNEAELAFVLGHEISHGMLGHFKINAASLADEDRRAYELAADRNALGLMALAGYDPRAAISAVRRICEAQDNDYLASNYPSMETRISQIERAIAASGWKPPGIVDRRDFRVFKSALLVPR